MISVILPIYNESQNLEVLHRRTVDTLSTITDEFELVFVNDGSVDDSYRKLLRLQESDPQHVFVIELSRNFGHHLAISAGLKVARGDIIVMMDSDLQDPPEEIPRLVQKLQEGYECVYGVRKKKEHPLFKRVTSRLYTQLMSWLTDLKVPVHTSIFRVMTRKFVDTYNKLPENDRYITGLMAWIGYRQIGIEVKHDPRYAGNSSYTFFKMIKLAFVSITSFSRKPLVLASWIGFTAFGLSVLGGIIVAYRKFVYDYGEIGWPSLMVTILALSGVQLLSLGLLGEYVGRAYSEQKKRPAFIIDEDRSVLPTSTHNCHFPKAVSME